MRKGGREGRKKEQNGMSVELVRACYQSNNGAKMNPTKEEKVRYCVLM